MSDGESTQRLKLSILPGTLAVCRLAPGEPIPPWFRPEGPLAGLTATDDELSFIVPDGDVPEGIAAERDWRAVKVLGPLDFALTGILSSLAAPLAGAGVSLFAVSTYDTDYILVKDADLSRARSVLEESFFFID